ncbi:DNA polymerase III alpha subunit [Mycoplasmopsis maculosa]|uniref:DNA-directed DNA polymerase n=1 Tax=Mycoplasmopsis maculosa TaxID=114885 RepID=A0A449B581_9BACT|nr:DNA polymerase III subunit alpha [Mycoplasmopsis maculosa]VEU75729.1 DNA polymerase III alpha subunit [Mycoplasmopsis maculosa]
MNKFINLYNTTEYSFLDSLIKVEELVSLSKKNGLNSVALTDHNNMFALGLFLKECQKNNMKPIIGVDLDVSSYRFILLAKNYDGFKKLNLLLLKKSKHDLEIDDILDENIYILDHPRLGYYAKTGKNDIKSSNYFVSSSDENIPNAVFIKENKLMNLEDNDTLNLIQKLGNNEITTSYHNYFDEIFLSKIIIDRINEIINNINIVFPKKELHLASFGENKKNILLEKIKNGFKKHKEELRKYENVFENRVNEELNTIIELNFIDYFLIISDLVEYAKNNNISIGPGRGSAAGSLIAYLLGITQINPLKFGLLFERFLNIQKISWPDIDIDIQDDKRDEIFNYLKNKYGINKTAFISTFQTMGMKQAIRDAGRILNISLKDINIISKSIFTFKNYETIEEEYENNLAFRTEIDKFPELLKHSKKMQGLPRQYGMHAAGFIISDKDISNYVPVFENSLGFQQVQIPMEFLEDFGLLKIDLLGLKTLTEIKYMEEKIKGVSLFDDLVNKNELELQDPLAINFLNRGLTEGLFQLESKGMKSTIKKVGINSFEDLYAIISLYRPGPKDYISIYSENRKNPKLIEKIHPLYDDILKETYGIIIYQEQIMQIAQKIANMSFSEADLLRKAISKKNENDLFKYREKFFNGGIKNGIDGKILNEIYDKIEKFALYGFNKSHAVSYAYLTMKMAYYKARYPQVYFAALISNSYGDQEKIYEYVEELKNLNFSVYSPEITNFSSNANVIDGDIYLPFNMIKGFGNESISKINEEIKNNGLFKNENIILLLLRLKYSGIKNAALSILIKASAFRKFGSQNFILKVNDFVENEFKVLTKKYKSYIEALNNLNIEQYKNVIINISNDENYININEQLDIERKNEIETLGRAYNISLTSAYEKSYKYRLKDFYKIDGIYKTVVEVLEYKELKSREFNVLNVQDSSISHTFYINKNKATYNPQIRKGVLIEITVNSKSGKLHIESWKVI